VARSHPPTLITLATRTLREECRLVRGDRVIVAVSGGPDSMALLDVLARLAPKLGFGLVAHGVDHGLRPEAASELDLAEAHADRLGVPFDRTLVSVEPGGNLQARARAARYRALENAQRSDAAKSHPVGCSEAAPEGDGRLTLLATAHHADDRAETVLLRLLRGSGPRGLAVLEPRTGSRIRPLIRARRADVLLHLERHHIPFATDPSNRDRRYQRVRVREELVPLLAELSPGIVGHLNALADALLSGEGESVLRKGAARVVLGRAQRLLLRRASSLGQRRASVRLSGGWEARIDPDTGETKLVRAAERRGQ
jgi:tRNA(Ile)-lysidine synthase